MELLTVTGLISVDQVTLADGHAHAWIEPVPSAIAPGPVLNDYAAMAAELTEFRVAGGTTLVDCQPGECGRHAGKLRQLAEATELHVTATTGYHLQRYYPSEHWLWSTSETEAAAFFVEELTTGTRETDGRVRATTIKVGYDGITEGRQRILLEAAAQASYETGAALLFHTEQGRNVEALLPFFDDRGVPLSRLYICHVDKRPDLGLHRELATAGALLGYDTFVRPKYDPEQGAWPLVRSMVAAGLAHAIAIGLDLALADMWQHYGGRPGMLALPKQIVPRLRDEGIDERAVQQITAANVARRLVWQRSETGS